MKHSESFAQLAAALVAAQTDIRAVEKSKTNPHFKSMYVPLDAIVAMARPALAKHGIAVVQSAPSDDGKSLRVETMLVHASGEWLSNEVCIPLAKADPQGAGAAMTYGRRFGLSSLLTLTSEEDDDGNAASRPAARTERGERPARQAAPRVAASPEPTAGAINTTEPEDALYEGKRLADYTTGELAAISLKMKAAGKSGWVRAIAAVRANRSLGVTTEPVLSDDTSVAKMKAAVEEESAALPFK